MYLLAEIDKGGYIREALGTQGRMVHRETRGIQNWTGCFDYLHEAKAAKEELRRDDVIILALTDEGGGSAVWVNDGQRALVQERLKVWSGCYGAWTVRKLR